MEYQPTVFLIDDDTDDQEIFSHAMMKANSNAHCVFASDGIKALDKLKENTSFVPDFIFIDMNMPRMNGQQCLAEIKKIDRLRDVPVYMYSTSTDPANIEENKRLGATDFIVKPSDVDDLIQILKRIIRKPVMAVLLVVLAIAGIPHGVKAQDTLVTIRDLKKLSVDELMNIVVTSVSKSPQNLSDVASAIQVVTGNDVKRSPVTRLTEALRLAPNLQVLQSGSHDWSITARGFNGSPVANSSLAAKLLVMIDGRTVYTPLFAGVYWDVQHVLLEDLNRIEVISGPGGTLWGPNAVNGVINILTKDAKETQGLYAEATYGSVLRDHFALRYGGQIDSTVFFRIYGQRFDSENSLLADGQDARDSWDYTTGGFRMDMSPTSSQTFTLQGEVYSGKEDDTLHTFVNGQHLLARWVNNLSTMSRTMVQAYFDRTWRDIRTTSFSDELITFDFEAQQQFPVGDFNSFVVGIGYRRQNDDSRGGGPLFDPEKTTLTLYSGFIQDQINLLRYLQLTVGSKFLHNDYTGFEVQPSVRMAWMPENKYTLWAAVSRNVRTPSRFERDYSYFRQTQHPDFISEKLMAYELGFRMRPAQDMSLSIAVFYNQYDDLRSFTMTGDTTYVFYFGNDLEANAWGLEFSSTTLISDWWRLRGGFTYLNKEFTYNSPDIFEGTELLEALDPEFQVIVQSVMDISNSLELDIVTRYISELSDIPIVSRPGIPSYVNVGARLAWNYKTWTFSLGGTNLLNDARIEVGRRQIPRNVYAKVTLEL